MWCLHFFLVVQASLAHDVDHVNTGRKSLAVDTHATVRNQRHFDASPALQPPAKVAAVPLGREVKNASMALGQKQDPVLDVRESQQFATISDAGRVTLGHCICILATVVVISATARLMLVRKQAEEPLDFISAVLLCGAYVAIAATSDILVKFETQANGGVLPFAPARMVFVIEFLKLCLTFPLVLGRFMHDSLRWPTQEDCTAAMRLMFVPAMSYSMNNAIIFFVVSRVDFSSLSVWRQMTPLFVAGIWVLIFRRQLGRQRWFALGLLVAGTALNSCGQTGGSSRFDAMVLMVLFSCLTTAVAGVANEYVLKRCGGLDIDFLCVLLYMQTSVISLVLAIGAARRFLL